jgi:hypothetical protein
LVAVSASGHLYQWRWCDMTPFRGDNPSGWSGSTISNGREPRSCLGRGFDSKSGCIAKYCICGKRTPYHEASSRVENSAQVTSCQLKFVHGLVLSFHKPWHSKLACFSLSRLSEQERWNLTK